MQKNTYSDCHGTEFVPYICKIYRKVKEKL
jgi:hypothetical protein